MIYIDSVKLSENKKYTKMQTQGKIDGCIEIVKEEIKTLLQYCKKDDDLRGVLLDVLEEVLHDN